MGKGRDKKKRISKAKARQEKAFSAGDDAGTAKQAKKKTKIAIDSSDDDEDLEAILESFRAEQAQKVKVSQEASVGGPSPRVNCSLQFTQSGSEAVFFGGEHFDGKCTRFFNDLFRCELKRNALNWKRVQSHNSPTPRSSHQAVITQGGTQMFLFGGEFGSSRETRFFHYKDFWMLDLKTFAWEELTSTCKPLPSPRSGHRMAIWKHIAVMFGGFYDAGADTKYLDDLWLFDTRAYQWTRVDWLNDPNTRPSPRSGFQLLPMEAGVLLYGGYCQVKGKGGVSEGVVLSDTWLLKLDVDDLRKTRWEKRKISASAAAPLPRSGPASVAARSGKSFYLFGGVRDEAIGDELINGTCLNDFWEFSMERGGWRQLQVAGAESIVPRYNACMTLLGSHLLLIGGIWEREDRQYVLDDAYVLNVEKMDKWVQVRPLSVDLENWAGEDSEDSEGSDESDGSSDCESEDESGSDSDESESDYSDSETETETETDSDSDSHSRNLNASQKRPMIDAPQPFPEQSLKDYFASNMQFWTHRAQSTYPTMTNSKQIRGEAFQMAQQAYNEFELERMFLK